MRWLVLTLVLLAGCTSQQDPAPSPTPSPPPTLSALEQDAQATARRVWENSDPMTQDGLCMFYQDEPKATVHMMMQHVSQEDKGFRVAFRSALTDLLNTECTAVIS